MDAGVGARRPRYISPGGQRKFIQLPPTTHHPHNKMLFRPLLAACLATLAVASPAQQLRAVANPQTPNQIIDAVIARAIVKIDALHWDVSKPVQDASTNFSIGVNSDGKAAESFDITSAKMTGIGSLDRSASWEFESQQKVLAGTLKLKNARASVSYKATFPGVGAAPSNNIAGTVVEKADNLFADVKISLNARKVPQAILNYTVRAGHDAIESSTGLSSSKMGAIDTAGIRHSLVQLMTDTFNTNVKVQINKAIQDWRAADAAANP